MRFDDLGDRGGAGPDSTDAEQRPAAQKCYQIGRQTTLKKMMASEEAQFGVKGLPLSIASAGRI